MRLNKLLRIFFSAVNIYLYFCVCVSSALPSAPFRISRRPLSSSGPTPSCGSNSSVSTSTTIPASSWHAPTALSSVVPSSSSRWQCGAFRLHLGQLHWLSHRPPWTGHLTFSCSSSDQERESHVLNSERITSKPVFCYQVPKKKKKKKIVYWAFCSFTVLHFAKLIFGVWKVADGFFCNDKHSWTPFHQQNVEGKKCADSGFQTAADVQIIKPCFFFSFLFSPPSILPLFTAEGLCSGVKETAHWNEMRWEETSASRWVPLVCGE